MKTWRPGDTVTLVTPLSPATPPGVYEVAQPWPPGEFDRHFCEGFTCVQTWFLRGPDGSGMFASRDYLDELEQADATGQAD